MALESLLVQGVRRVTSENISTYNSMSVTLYIDYVVSSSCERHWLHAIRTLVVSAGNPDESVNYKVQFLHTSKSLTFVAVDAHQAAQAVTHSIEMLGRNELGLEHQTPMPQAVSVRALPPERERVETKNRNLSSEQHEILRACFSFETCSVNEAKAKAKPPDREHRSKLERALDDSPAVRSQSSAAGRVRVTRLVAPASPEAIHCLLRPHAA